jgi:hypothetical protein
MKRRDFMSAAAAVIVAPTAMSQTPSAPLLCLGSSCQSGQLSNGSSFTVTGSGFGTKSASAPTVYDNCQGTNILSLWSHIWHHDAAGGWGEAYHLPTDLTPNGDAWGQSAANYVGPATPFRSKYICSALESSEGGYGAGNMMFGLSNSTLAPPYYLACSWYECISPNWVFNVPYSGSGESAPGDNNFKWVVYTTELTGGYGSLYWYMEDQNSAFRSATSAPAFDINDDGAGIVGRSKQYPSSEWVSPAMPNKYYNTANGWVKKELSMYMTSGTNGFVSMAVSVPKSQPRWNGYLWNNTNGTGTTDPYGGSGRTFWLGGFRRDFPQALNRQYWSDVYLDIQTSGLGRFALTDTNSLATATVVEWQPYTSWSNTSVTLTCSKGNLSSGTVYLWLLDEVNGSKLIGSYTMS